MDVDNFMPNRQERFAPLVARIPSGWGRWISVGEGWAELVIKLDRDIAVYDPDYQLHQCKEKFGGLRYYIGHVCNNKCRDGFVKEANVKWWTPDCFVDDLVKKAEKASFLTCEKCGLPGVLRNKQGWWATTCEKHGEGAEIITTEDE